MENVRNRINFELLCDEEKLQKRIAKAHYNGHKIFGAPEGCDDDSPVVGVHMLKKTVELFKPIYAGMAILDLSKVLMYDFHYNTMLKRYGPDKLKLLFTDTDSLCYSVQTEDLYQDFKEFADEFDFSEYPKEHLLYDEVNKKVIVKFKDETKGIPISEFVGVRSKMYCFKYTKGSKEQVKKTAKGIKSNVIQNKLTFADYYDAILGDRAKQMVEMNCIRSKNHNLVSQTVNKVGICAYDNKRYLLPDGVSSYAYGHYACEQYLEELDDIWEAIDESKLKKKFQKKKQNLNLLVKL
jgi:hypothetical protein